MTQENFLGGNQVVNFSSWLLHGASFFIGGMECRKERKRLTVMGHGHLPPPALVSRADKADGLIFPNAFKQFWTLFSCLSPTSTTKCQLTISQTTFAAILEAGLIQISFKGKTLIPWSPGDGQLSLATTSKQTSQHCAHQKMYQYGLSVSMARCTPWLPFELFLNGSWYPHTQGPLPVGPHVFVLVAIVV